MARRSPRSDRSHGRTLATTSPSGGWTPPASRRAVSVCGTSERLGSSRRSAQNPAGSGSRPTAPACTPAAPARRSPSTSPAGQRSARFDGLGALALSPDGRTIAINMTQDRIGLFDTASGRRRAQLAGHDAAVTAAAFSADGTMLASVSNDETVIVWDVSTGERRQQFHGHAGSVLGVDFSADGSELYTSGADGSVIIWDLDRTRGLTRDVLGPSVLGRVRPQLQPDRRRRAARRRALPPVWMCGPAR